MEAPGERTGGSNAVAEAAAPARGSGAEGSSRGLGLRLQRTETKWGKTELGGGWAARALHRHNAVTAVSPSGWGQDDARILTRTKVHPPISSLSMVSLQRERAPKHQFKH